MSDPDNLMAGFVRGRCEPNSTEFERTKAAEFLFEVAEKLILATNPRHERFRFPLSGKTPFYQGSCSDVMIIDRLATAELSLLPYYDADNDIQRSISSQLAIDTRRQYKRNKLPVPVAFGRLALSPTAYKDKVLRIIQTDREELLEGSGLRESIMSEFNYGPTLLMNDLGYSQRPSCSASGTEIVVVAEHIETMSRVLGAHHLVEEAVLGASA